MTAVVPHQTHRSFVTSYETAPNARQTTQTERRWAGNSRPASRLDPQVEHKAPIGRPLPVNFVICQLGRGGHLGRKPRLRDRQGRPKHATSPRSDPRGERASPCVPHFNFLSPVVRRREPPEKTARSSAEEDRGSISARLAPAVDRDAQPAPRSRPVKPRTREQEPRLTCNVHGALSAFAESVTFWRFYHATSA